MTDAKGPGLNFVHAPDLMALDLACHMLFQAYGTVPYLVGSAITRRDFRDVDVRMILDDEEYAALFPRIDRTPGTSHPRYALLCSAISAHLSRASGLPVDFQFQSRTLAARFAGPCQPLGIFPVPRDVEAEAHG